MLSYDKKKLSIIEKYPTIRSPKVKVFLYFVPKPHVTFLYVTYRKKSKKKKSKRI